MAFNRVGISDIILKHYTNDKLPLFCHLFDSFLSSCLSIHLISFHVMKWCPERKLTDNLLSFVINVYTKYIYTKGSNAKKRLDTKTVNCIYKMIKFFSVCVFRVLFFSVPFTHKKYDKNWQKWEKERTIYCINDTRVSESINELDELR